MMTSTARRARAWAAVGVVGAALGMAACDGKKRSARTGYGALAACGIAYDVPEGWTVVDPSTEPTYTFPAIGPDPSVAELDGPDGMHVVVQCVARWTKATTTTCDQGTTAVGFDDYVQRCHGFYASGPLSSDVRVDDLALGDGGTLKVTTAHLGRGLVDGTASMTAFGAAQVGGRHVVIRASAPPAAFDQAGLARLVGSLRPR